MFDFLAKNYFIPLYVAALIISLIRYRYYFESVLKYFPMFIAYTLVTELIGILIRDFEGFQIVYEESYHYANYLVFNIYDVVFFIYFYSLFWRVVKNLKSRRIIMYGALIYVIAAIVNPFFQNVLVFPQIYASTVGSIILIVAIFLYYNEIKKQKEKKRNLMVWISFGLLVFNLLFPFISLTARFDYDLYQRLFLRQIHYILIVIMYSCFVLGFLLMRQMRPKEA